MTEKTEAQKVRGTTSGMLSDKYALYANEIKLSNLKSY